MSLKHSVIRLAIFIASLPLSATAQNPVHFTSDNGLSNSCVRRIYEDSRHNVWICTRNGLNRYDGAKMNVYHHDTSNPRSLGNDIVTYILELDPDHILVAHEGGLQSFNYATDDFTDIPMIKPDGDTLRTHIVAMTQFLNGDIHITATTEGSYIVRKKANGEYFAEHTDKFFPERRRPNFFINTKKDEVFVLNEHGQVELHEGKKVGIIDGIDDVKRMCLGKDGTLYAVTGSKLMRYDRKARQFEAIESEAIPAGTVIKSVRSNGSGLLMICTDGSGLKIYDEATERLTQSLAKSLEFDLESSNVEDAMYDSHGNLWVGVYWKGVVVFPKTQSLFEYVGHRSPSTNSIGSTSVTSILPSSQGGAWVGTDHNGLYRMNESGTQSQHWHPATTPGVPETIASMLEDSRGMVWLGSSIGGMTLMNPQTGTFTPFTAVCPEGADVKFIFDMVEDEQHNIWIASMGNGLFRYSLDDRSLRKYLGNENDPSTGVPIPWVACLAVRGNRLYVGCSSGMYVYSMQPDGTLKHIDTPIRSFAVNDVRIAPYGTVWIATSQGVYCIATNGEMRGVTRADGLADNHICSIQLEQRGRDIVVWASTDHGLNRIETDHGVLAMDSLSNTITSFFVSDGLQGNEFSNGVSAQLGGMMYFGGINGLNFFNPGKIDKAKASINHDFHIVSFYIFGSPVNAGDKSGSYDVMDAWVAEAEELHVCYSDNTFSLELAPVNLMASGAVYEYSINGDEWINLGEGQNRISFTNMASGTYKVRIRVAGNTDRELERSITIVVHPAWYASPLAYIIYILLLLLVAYFIMQQVKERIKARKVLQRHKQEEELNEARIQFFMNISHEIRTPMTLILAPLEKLRSMDTDAEHQRNYKLIHQNAHRILRLINQLMDVRKIEKGQFKLDFEQIDIVEFVESLYDVYETSAKNRAIDFRFEHDGIERLDAMVDTDSFDKIVMNLLSNAFKFTPDEGSIVIRLEADEEEGLFTLSVTDSGMGVPDDEKKKVFKRFYSSKHQNGYIGTGIGLNLTALLVDLHEGEISVEDNPAGQGAQFVVSLPMKHSENATIPVNSEFSENSENSEYSELSETSNLSETSRTTSLPTHDELREEAATDIKAVNIRNRNLLVVEDDAAIRQYIHSELAADFTIHECGNGMEGWEYVQKNPEKVDLIISDIMMPVMEGTTLCQKVKGNFNTSHIPVILMSAKTTEADRIAGMSIGADAYVTKPFNLELLRTTALSILKQRQMLRGKFTTAAQHEGKIEQIELTSPDEHLMERVMKAINANMDNPDLSVELIADKVGVSRVHFHRKIKELTGQTPRDFIKSIRLKEAARLLSEKHLDITDVSIATGFKSLSTFSTSFKQAFGQTPTEYMKQRLEKS